MKKNILLFVFAIALMGCSLNVQPKATTQNAYLSTGNNAAIGTGPVTFSDCTGWKFQYGSVSVGADWVYPVTAVSLVVNNGSKVTAVTIEQPDSTICSAHH